jgi:hypothetical protein
MIKMKYTSLLAIPALLLAACGAPEEKKEVSLEQTEEKVDLSKQTISGDLSYGSITIKPGYPVAEDMTKLKELLRLNRGIELFLWSLPFNQSYSDRDALFESSGGGMYDVIYVGGFSDHLNKLSTINNETIYATVQIDLNNGPVVYEQPSMDKKGYLFGSIFNTWHVPLTDLGVPKAAPDNGKGGKYLILPPKYEGEIPKGYFVVHAEANLAFLGMRSVMLGGATVEDAIERVKRMKVYPLSNPSRPQKYIDVAGKPIEAEISKGVSAFRRMHEYVSTEIIEDRNAYMVGMLRTLGIEKGKPFPDDKATLDLLQRSADLGWMTAKQNFTESWEPSVLGGTWLAIGDAATWNPEYLSNDAVLVNRRAAYYTAAIWPPKNMGTSTYYTINFFDREGHSLVPGANYKLHLPAKVPAKSFWSVILYDAETMAMIENPLKKYTVNSLNKNLKYNEDGSVDIYFGPSAPDNMKENWIPTTENDFFPGIRFYGPDFERLGKDWKVSGIELVK